MVKRSNICAVATCSPSSRKTGNTISFYSFPKKLDVRKKWIRACKRKSYLNPDTARICSVHFRETDYARDLQAELLGYTPRRKLLKEGTVPSLNLPGQILKSNTDTTQGATGDFSAIPVSGSCTSPLDTHATSPRESRALKRDIRKRALNRISKLSPKRKKLDESKVDLVGNESSPIFSAPINCNKDTNMNNSLHSASVLGIHLTPLDVNTVPKHSKCNMIQFNKIESKEKTIDSVSKEDFGINESSLNTVSDSIICNVNAVTTVPSFSSLSGSVNCVSAMDIQTKPLVVRVSNQKIKKCIEKFNKVAPKMPTMDSSCIIHLQGSTVSTLNFPEQSAVSLKGGTVPTLNTPKQSLKLSPNTSIPLQAMITSSSASPNALCNSGSSTFTVNNADTELQIHTTPSKKREVLKWQIKKHLDEVFKVSSKKRKVNIGSNLDIIPKNSSVISNNANSNASIVTNDSSLNSIQGSTSCASMLDSIHAKSPLGTNIISAQNVRKCAMKQLIKISPKWREVYSNSKGVFLKRDCLNCSKVERQFFYKSLRYKRHITSVRKRNSVLQKQIKNLKSELKEKDYIAKYVKGEVEAYTTVFNSPYNSVADSVSYVPAVDILAKPLEVSTVSKQNINQYSMEQVKIISAEEKKLNSNCNAKFVKNDCLNCSVMKRQIFSDSLRRKSLLARTKKRITVLENVIFTLLKENKNLKIQLEKKDDCIAERVQEEVKKVYTGILTKQQIQCLANGEKKDFHQIMLIDPFKKNTLPS